MRRIIAEPCERFRQPLDPDSNFQPSLRLDKKWKSELSRGERRYWQNQMQWWSPTRFCHDRPTLMSPSDANESRSLMSSSSPSESDGMKSTRKAQQRQELSRLRRALLAASCLWFYDAFSRSWEQNQGMVPLEIVKARQKLRTWK